MGQNELESGLGGAPAPQEATPNPLQPGPSRPSEMLQHLGDMQEQAIARFQKMKSATRTLGTVRQVMDKLVALGDTVTQEDLVKGAGELVAGGGLTAVAVAGILADAPEGGEALQGWIQEQDQMVQQREAQAQQALAMTRHEMGLTAMRHLIGASAEGAASQPPPPESEPAGQPAALNPLEPGAPSYAS